MRSGPSVNRRDDLASREASASGAAMFGRWLASPGPFSPQGHLTAKPPLHRDLRPGREAALLRVGGGERGLAHDGDGPDVHTVTLSRMT